MSKIKEFYKKHEKDINTIGSVVAITVGFMLVTKHYKNKNKKLVDLKGRSAIMWNKNQDGEIINIDRVKEILDLNADTTGAFAIFREGPRPDQYICLVLDSDVKYTEF